MSNYKLLISCGCSFTFGVYNWPTPLQELLNCSLNNYGTVSVGNGKISRSAIYGTTEALKTYDANEIIVGIVWSGNNRREFFQSNVDKDNVYVIGTENPHGFIPNYKNWVTVNHHWSDIYSKNFYRYFYDRVDSEIITLEHILRTQWFLEKHKVKYFMSVFAPGVLPESKEPNTEYLTSMIDFTKFLPIKSVMEWCFYESGFPVSEFDRLNDIGNIHPTFEQSIKLANEIILPFIKQL